MLRRKVLSATAILLILLLGFLFLGSAEIEVALSAALEEIGKHLWLLFLAIAILPALGVPNCPLMIVGGGAAAAVYGSGAAVTIAVLAVITNIVWSYWVAAYPLRSVLWERIESRAQTRWLTELGDRSVTRATFVLHITPGVPLFIQTYFPGLHRLHYGKYLLIAVPVQSLYTALIVLTSGEVLKVLQGNLMVAGLVLLLVLMIWKTKSSSTAQPSRSQS